MADRTVPQAMWVARARILAFFVLALFVAVLIGMVLGAKPAHADTFTVNSIGDTGDVLPGNGSCLTGNVLPTRPECTLRAAIEEANANDNNATVVDEIRFAIPGVGPHTIAPATSLPTITEPLVIDGYTQGDTTADTADDATENTRAVGNNADLRIRLDGLNTTFDGQRIQADGSVVRGLSITRFGAYGIDIAGAAADNNIIEGNFIGITPGGQDGGNGNGLVIRIGASGNTVGGTSPGARNIISGNGPSSNFSGTGIALSETGTTGNKVQGNYIGTTKSGTGNLGNTGRGIFVGNGASANLIGDNDPSDGMTNAANIIAFNGVVGVDVSGTTSTGNSIMGNSIFSHAGLGIDLGTNGVTPNDGAGDADTGPNNLQNFPVITSASTGKKGTAIKGTLEGVPSSGLSQAYTIQFFKSPKDTKDEGKKSIGELFVVDTDNDGVMPFTFKPSRRVKEGMFVTATATYSGDTSEFSAPEKVRG